MLINSPNRLSPPRSCLKPNPNLERPDPTEKTPCEALDLEKKMAGNQIDAFEQFSITVLGQSFTDPKLDHFYHLLHFKFRGLSA